MEEPGSPHLPALEIQRRRFVHGVQPLLGMGLSAFALASSGCH